LIKNTQAKFLIISSRQVYGIHEDLHLFKESAEINPKRITNYGLNKLKSEKNIADSLRDESRLIICRSSNIFGEELGLRNFLDIALISLIKHGFISLDLNRKVIKDFLPVRFHSKFIESLIINDASGIFNIGSGVQTSLQDICDALISGFGSGHIKDNNIVDDQFSMDVSKLNKLINFDITKDVLLSNIHNISSKYRS
jgi:nucleoside-diphosphate-sugar epimerase